MVENYIKFDKENTCYKCPHCKKGNLYLSQDKLFEKQYETSIKKGTYKVDYRIYECEYEYEYEYEDRYYHGTISGQLKCNNIDCSEMTSFIGETKYYLNYYFDENSNDDVEVLEKGIYFKYFIPPIHIIEIRKDVNDELNKILLESFNLYFSSYYSCANSLRIFLEKLCELRGIRREDEKGNFITLNQRLNKIDIDSDITNLLLAIKWIGNEGSHSIDIVKKEDLDLTYKFVKKILEYFYPIDNDSKVLQELANEVINEKGVLSKNKKHSFVD